MPEIDMNWVCSQAHKKAMKDGHKLGEAHSKWMLDLLERLQAYWEEPDTPLPHIDLFDEVSKAVSFPHR